MIEENSRDGSYFLITKGDDNEFVIMPHFNSNTDFLSFVTFLQIWAQTMIQNGATMIGHDLTEGVFGEDEEEE